MKCANAYANFSKPRCLSSLSVFVFVWVCVYPYAKEWKGAREGKLIPCEKARKKHWKWRMKQTPNRAAIPLSLVFNVVLSITIFGYAFACAWAGGDGGVARFCHIYITAKCLENIFPFHLTLDCALPPCAFSAVFSLAFHFILLPFWLLLYSHIFVYKIPFPFYSHIHTQRHTYTIWWHCDSAPCVWTTYQIYAAPHVLVRMMNIHVFYTLNEEKEDGKKRTKSHTACILYGKQNVCKFTVCNEHAFLIMISVWRHMLARNVLCTFVMHSTIDKINNDWLTNWARTNCKMDCSGW